MSRVLLDYQDPILSYEIYQLAFAVVFAGPEFPCSTRREVLAHSG